MLFGSCAAFLCVFFCLFVRWLLLSSESSETLLSHKVNATHLPVYLCTVDSFFPVVHSIFFCCCCSTATVLVCTCDDIARAHSIHMLAISCTIQSRFSSLKTSTQPKANKTMQYNSRSVTDTASVFTQCLASGIQSMYRKYNAAIYNNSAMWLPLCVWRPSEPYWLRVWVRLKGKSGKNAINLNSHRCVQNYHHHHHHHHYSCAVTRTDAASSRDAKWCCCRWWWRTFFKHANSGGDGKISQTEKYLDWKVCGTPRSKQREGKKRPKNALFHLSLNC